MVGARVGGAVGPVSGWARPGVTGRGHFIGRPNIRPAWLGWWGGPDRLPPGAWPTSMPGPLRAPPGAPHGWRWLRPGSHPHGTSAHWKGSDGDRTEDNRVGPGMAAGGLPLMVLSSADIVNSTTGGLAYSLPPRPAYRKGILLCGNAPKYQIQCT